MKLLEIEIRNLKSITNATLTFPSGRADYQVSLLYGDNGAGKTTVLEAISLLGHLSTMRRIHVSGADVVSHESRFRQSKTRQQEERPDPATALREEEYEQYREEAFDDQRQLIRTAGLAGWWESASVSGDPFRRAIIRYHVLHQNEDFEFFISFLQNRDLSITEALSRDQKSPGAKIHDGNMDNWFAVVYDLPVRDRLENLIEHMERVSPHSYWSKAGTYQTDSRAASRTEAHSLVAYWNTDLNDFGRKNDLRESVKKIRLDFADQMITRLGLALPHGDPTCPQYLDISTLNHDQLSVLNDSLKRALVDHAVAMQRERKRLQEEGLIRITEIDVRSNPASMRARRIADDRDIEIDHLSAGENESVFIFLLMHGMPCRDSIILLDEPDLHLSDFAKPQFYNELYRLAHAAKCQLIISTHSAFAYASTAEEHRSHHFLRREREVDDAGVTRVVFKTEWDERFGELLAFYYIRCALQAMSEAGPVWKRLSLPLKWSVRVGERLGLDVWTTGAIFAASFGLYAILATLNDLFFVTYYKPTWHRGFILGGAMFCGLLCTWFLLLRFLPQWMKERSGRSRAVRDRK